MTKKKIWIGVIVLAVAAFGYYTISPLWRNTTANDVIPNADQAVTLSEGSLQAAAHGVQGTTKILQTASGTVLRFENLSVSNGPDLRIYLSASEDNADYVDLGPIKATQGNVNYDIPAGTDVAKYHYALIWCRTFHVLFSYSDMR